MDKSQTISKYFRQDSRHSDTDLEVLDSFEGKMDTSESEPVTGLSSRNASGDMNYKSA